MALWQWILIAAAGVIVINALIATAFVVRSRRRTTRLKQHYGLEYERLAAESGDPRSAEEELTARERAHDRLDIVALSPSAHTHFNYRWRRVQTEFVDDPARAVAAADHLVTEVMRERGYPVEDFNRRAADISVDHPEIVENYRAAHGIHMSQQNGEISTERQREAFVHYRALFDALLETRKDSDTAQEASA
jgi:hypothetical protein